jgi:HPt (histidine-containing phosphotransfer) domain-containing protein
VIKQPVAPALPAPRLGDGQGDGQGNSQCNGQSNSQCNGQGNSQSSGQSNSRNSGSGDGPGNGQSNIQGNGQTDSQSSGQSNARRDSHNAGAGADDPGVLDIAGLHELFTGEPEFVAELLQTFSDSAHALMASIPLAAAHEDGTALRGFAHQLKGAAGNVRAGALARAAGMLELCSHDERAARIQALEQAWHALQSRLPAPRAGSPRASDAKTSRGGSHRASAS